MRSQKRCGVLMTDLIFRLQAGLEDREHRLQNLELHRIICALRVLHAKHGGTRTSRAAQNSTGCWSEGRMP